VKTRIAAILCAAALVLPGVCLAAAPKVAKVPAKAQAKAETLPPAALKGEPAIKPGAAQAVYVWVDAKGVHVRWTSDGKPVLFSGKLELDKAFGETDFKRVNALCGGWVQNHGERILMFSSTARTEVDGFDLATPAGSTARLEVEIDGKVAEPEKVFFGDALGHAKELPVKFAAR
jgi:hypothetical protein